MLTIVCSSPRLLDPQIPRIAESLMTLLDELQTLEGKRRVLNSVDVMIEREGVDVRPLSLRSLPPPTRLHR